MELTVAVTGASGSIYAHRTLLHMAASGAVERINLIMSGSALVVARVEMGAKIAAKPSSGSHPQAGMVIVPCSMGTLGAIASGAGTNLIHRAADVTLKEGRRLVIVARETPLNAIHIENMLRLSRAGARIMPASPGFYHRPQTIEQLVDHFVFRVLDHFDIPHPTGTRWKGEG
jgi:4-hydroxy-3-polyprenylbenzoate decarboxylase